MTRSPSAAARWGASDRAFVLALVGFLLALATAGYVVYRDPPWGRLSKYDFSNAEGALRSQIRMEADADILALVEYAAKVDRKHRRERLDTLEIKQTRDFDGKKVVFYQFKQTDRETNQTKDRKEVQWFEKDDDTGYWKRTFVDNSRVRGKDEGLAEDIEKWIGRGGIGGFPD